jgi:ketosteroid isomerase-like protein
MKHVLMTTAVFLALSLCVAGQESSQQKETPTASAGIEEQLKKLEVERNHAMVSGDLATLDRTTASDYTVINPSGHLGNKKQMLADLRSGNLKCQSIEVEDVTVHLYGDAAILSGRRTVKGQHHGKDISGKDRFTRVYAKRNGQWQAVWFQSTRVR